MKILLNNKEFHFSEADLPLLIHGAHKAGASLFSVTVAVQMFLIGKKLLFFTAYPMAREEFMAQIAGSGKEKDVFYLEREGDIAKASEFCAVIVKSGDSELCLKAFRELSGIKDRVVLVKNIESVLTGALFSAVKGHDKLILSGDLDGVSFAGEITPLGFRSKVFFSKPAVDTGISVPDLEKYVGFMSGRENGLITLNKS
jgi:hypothetical protein